MNNQLHNELKKDFS